MNSWWLPRIKGIIGRTTHSMRYCKPKPNWRLFSARKMPWHRSWSILNTGSSWLRTS